MRVIYLFYCDKMVPVPGQPWGEQSSKHPLLGPHMRSEGFYYLWRELIADGTLDEVLIVVTTRRETGWRDYSPGLRGLAIPNIEDLDDLLRPDDILFVRGHFKKWHTWLVAKQEQGHWLLLYPANTGRERKTIWDIIWEDRREEYRLDVRERLWWPLRKPTNPEVFSPMTCKKKYDLCIGASTIHDKKGQWRTINVMAAYATRYGEKLRAVLPGGIRHGTHSSGIADRINDYELDVDRPGKVTREGLCTLLNQSRCLIVLGWHGQNDRGPLEALACGTPLFLLKTAHRAPSLYGNQHVVSTVDDPDDLDAIVLQLHDFLGQLGPTIQADTYAYHLATHGFDAHVRPRAQELFACLRELPRREPEALWSYYGDRLQIAQP